jgi:hypothetical protein
VFKCHLNSALRVFDDIEAVSFDLLYYMLIPEGRVKFRDKVIVFLLEVH